MDTPPHSAVLQAPGRIGQGTELLHDGRRARAGEHIAAIADWREFRCNEAVRRSLCTLLQGRVPQAQLTARNTRHSMVLICHRQGRTGA